MKIYKYRALAPGDELALERLERILRHRLSWCARPDTLNDPAEFAWTCDFNETRNTANLVAELLQEAKGRSAFIARQIAIEVIRRGRLGELGAPVIDDMIQRQRDEVGIACFGTTPDNPTLWARYGGDGAGVCVELDVSDSLVGTQLHRVVYNDHRRLHIDDFLRSRNDLRFTANVYAALLTKTRYWKPEGEIRFISKRQQVEVVIDESTVTEVILGSKLDQLVSARVEGLAGVIPVARLRTPA
jgi:hypothetical protein